MSQPRRNEVRFYRYPMHRVAAIIDDEGGVQAALDALRQAEVDVTKVNVLSGREGARLLDRTGTGHGLRARLLRLAQWGAYEATALDAHERALNDGHHVIFVPVRSDDQRSQVIDILRAAGGHYLLHFRLWSIELLP
jgi:DNA-binding NarL/FixJ family response regulator